MKKLTLFLAILLATCWIQPTIAQNAFTVIANPGENASTEVRLNWHTDPDSEASLIIYTPITDKDWREALTARAAQELITAFDSIYSKKANNEDYYERVKLIRNTVALQDLKPGTEYMYKIATGTENQDPHPTDSAEIRYFKTASQTGKWTMGLISDIHVYAPLPKRQQAAMEMIGQLEIQNKKDFDAMLHAGDLSAWGGSYSFWTTLYDEPYFRKYLWAGVNGNHDNMTRENGQSNDYFRYVNNNPLNGYAGEKGVVYHFTYDNALFIMLNNEAMKKEEELAEAQQWVRQVIRDNPATYTIVVSHYEWFNGNDGRSSQYGRWNTLFDECGVDLALSGNYHVYARTNALYADQETDGSQGTVYLQTPSSDNARGRTMSELAHNQDLIRFRWTEGPNTVGALILNADNTHLTLTLYDRHGTEIDQVTVKAKKH